jgi:hypothetical protein
MLAVVEDEEHRRVANRADERFHGPTTAIGDVERGRDFSRDARGIGDRGEVDPPDSCVSRRVGRGDLASETGFAASTGSGQCKQTRGPDQSAELAQLMCAADEPGQVNR